MSENKCFCHLGEFEVKDATARREHAALREEWDETIIEIDRVCTDHESRIYAIEQGGSGGGKLYKHVIQVYIQDDNSHGECTFQFIIYDRVETNITNENDVPATLRRLLNYNAEIMQGKVLSFIWGDLEEPYVALYIELYEYDGTPQFMVTFFDGDMVQHNTVDYFYESGAVWEFTETVTEV